MDTSNNPISSFEGRLLIGAAAAALAIVGGALWYTQASASPASVADMAVPVPVPGPVMPDLIGMDVTDARSALESLGIASTATDTCVVNGCHAAIVECNDGDGGWIDVRATGAEKVRSQELEPGADLAGVGHVGLISVDYCPLGDFEQPLVEVEPEMPAEEPQPVDEPEREAPFMPAPAPVDPEPAPETPVIVVESPDEPEIEEPWEDDDEADTPETDDDDPDDEDEPDDD